MSELTNKLMTFDDESVAMLYKRVFDSVDAKLVLEDLRNRCFVKISSCNINMNNTSERTIFNEGMRSVVLHIESQLNYEPVPNQEEDNESNV